MRVLFMLTHAGLFRNFDSTLRLAVERGHDVHVALESDRYPSDAFEALVAAHDNLTTGPSPSIAGDRWAVLGRHVRAASDYLRYRGPLYANAPKLRERARRQVPPWLRPAVRDGADPARADRRLRAIERALPVNQAVAGFLRERAPDLLVISPLFGSPVQLEALRAARALGIPSCLSVASWDNLTNKGLIRELPGTVIVWNDAQRAEATELHAVPGERVVVTGAQNFDEWFSRTASVDAAAFKRRVGLPDDRPYVLYLGSSGFIAPDEASFGVRWLAALRANPDTAGVGVLIRPHPQNARQWVTPEIEADPLAAVWPAPEATPQMTGRADWSREDFMDSMLHAAAVVGVNTTAMIESGVLGKSVHTVLDAQFRDTQGGTLHFAHLCSVNGGLLHVADALPEHVVQLAGSLARGDATDPRSRAFVEAFVRPHGLDRPATPFVLDALERAAAQPAAAGAPASRSVALPVLAAVAVGSDRYVSGFGRGLARRRKRFAKRRTRLVRLVRRRLRTG
jgi:hypothetical protein